MAKIPVGNTLKRLQNRYRLTVMNDDTYEEVATFRLSRLSVYIALSSVCFVSRVYRDIARFHPIKILYTWLWKEAEPCRTTTIENAYRLARTSDTLSGAVH